MKILRNAIIALFAIFALAIFSRDAIIKFSLEKCLRDICGLNISISKFEFGILKPDIRVNNLVIHNPNGFPEKDIMNFPLIYLRYDLKSLFTPKPHLYEINAHLKELNLIRNREGKLNLEALTVAGQKINEINEKLGNKSKDLPEVSIDALKLRIDRVLLNDYSQSPVLRKEFNLNIDRQYRQITDMRKLVLLIVFEAIRNTSIINLVDFNLNALSLLLKRYIPDGIGKAEGIIASAAGTVINKAGDILDKKLNPASEIISGILGVVQESGTNQ